MSEPIEPAAEPLHPSADSATKTLPPCTLSIIGLIAAVLALGLAVIPAMALGRALANPFAEEVQAPPPPAERDGGVTVKISKLTLQFGGKTPPPAPLPVAPPKLTKDPVRWFTIAAMGCSLVGFLLAVIGHLRERHTVLTISTLGCCVAAMTWQYVAVGIAFGVGAVVFLVFLAVIGSALS